MGLGTRLLLGIPIMLSLILLPAMSLPQKESHREVVPELGTGVVQIAREARVNTEIVLYDMKEIRRSVDLLSQQMCGGGISLRGSSTEVCR